MKIIIATDSFPPRCDGSGWSTLQLCRSLKSRGYEITVAMPGKDGKRQYGGFTIHQFSRGWLGFRKGLEELAARIRPDVIHAQHMKSCIALSRIEGIKKVCTVRDYWPTFYDGSRFNVRRGKNYKRTGYLSTLHSIFWKNGPMIKLLSPAIALYMVFRTMYARRCLERMDNVICVSRFVSKATPLKAEKKKAIPNMVDLDKLKEYRKEGFSRNIVFAGKFNHMKGALEAAKTVSLLPRDSFKEAYFFGKGPLEKKMKKILGNRGKFMGHKDESELFEKMAGSIVLLPAKWDEPLGRTILEAISLGATVLTTPTGGTPEIIENGKDGSLCMPDPNVMKAELLRIIKYDVWVYMNNAKEKAKRFDQNRLINEYEKVYKLA